MSNTEATAGELIRTTPALLAEAKGWICDAFNYLDTGTFDTSGVIALLGRSYEGGCAEFVRNSAPLIPAPPADEWLTIPARELQRGDSLQMSRENGRSSGSTLTVLGLSHLDGGFVNVQTRLGDYSYRPAEVVQVFRDARQAGK